jgi:hypothetical protein
VLEAIDLQGGPGTGELMEAVSILMVQLPPLR